MPDSDGDDVAALMRRIKLDVRILMFSGVSDVPDNARLHVDAFLQKGQSPPWCWIRFRSYSNHPTKRPEPLAGSSSLSID
jgi:hypothetical protein